MKTITKEEFSQIAHNAGFDPEYSGKNRTFYLHPKSGAEVINEQTILDVIRNYHTKFTVILQ